MIASFTMAMMTLASILAAVSAACAIGTAGVAGWYVRKSRC